jgi:hypothetical protein
LTLPWPKRDRKEMGVLSDQCHVGGKTEVFAPSKDPPHVLVLGPAVGSPADTPSTWSLTTGPL